MSGNGCGSLTAWLREQDYIGAAVNAQNFLDVLAGEEESPAILGTSGKVIKSGPNDRIFVYFADHGAPGTSYSRPKP